MILSLLLETNFWYFLCVNRVNANKEHREKGNQITVWFPSLDNCIILCKKIVISLDFQVGG